MKLLSRPEELFLLAIWKLRDNAYAVTIRNKVNEITGKTWSFGAIFITLERLVKKHYLTSHLTEPTPKRGGRSKRVYKLTKEGIITLKEIKKLEEAMWADTSDLFLAIEEK